METLTPHRLAAEAFTDTFDRITDAFPPADPAALIKASIRAIEAMLDAGFDADPLDLVTDPMVETPDRLRAIASHAVTGAALAAAKWEAADLEGDELLEYAIDLLASVYPLVAARRAS